MDTKLRKLELPILICIILVQILSGLTSYESIASISTFVEIVVVPLLVFDIARRTKMMNNKEKEEISKKCLIGFFILQFINYLINFGDSSFFDIWKNQYYNWILLAIPVWMGLIPILRRYKHPILICLFIMFLILISVTSHDIDLIQRISQLSIFYLLGIIYKENDIYGKDKKKRKIILLNSILAIFVFVLLFRYDGSIRLFNIYDIRIINVLKPIIVKTLIMYISISVGRAILIAMPNIKEKKKKVDYTLENYILVLSIMSFIIGVCAKYNYFGLINNFVDVIWATLIILGFIILSLILEVKDILIEYLNKLKLKITKLIDNLKIESEKEEVEIAVQYNGRLKKIISTCTKIANTRLIVIPLIIVVMLKTILFYKDTVYTEISVWDFTFFSTVIFLIYVSVLILLIRNSKTRFNVSIVVSFIFSLILFGDDVYYKYASNVLSLKQLSNMQYVGEITAALPTLMEIKYILYFIDFIIIGLLVFLKVIDIHKIKQKRSKVALILILMLAMVFSSTMERSIKLIRGFPFNIDSQIRYGTIYGYHCVDIFDTIFKRYNIKYKDYDSMNTSYTNLKNEYNNKYTTLYNLNGCAKNKNVIVLQLESIQNFVVNSTINGKEITPNINKFLNENIRFTNMQNQSFTSTADSEHSVDNSIYPIENGMAFSRFFYNDYNNIFSNYKNAGYTTMYMHGNEGSFWNRKNVYSRMPVDDISFIDSFNDTSEIISDYLSDELLYKQAVEKIKNKTVENKNPMFINIVSASSHTPFELKGIQDKDSKVNIDVGKYKDTFFGNYLEAVNYADYTFGLFIKDLQDNGLYDDTVIMIYGDHAGVPMYDDEMTDYLKSQNSNINDIQVQVNYTNVVCGMHLPGTSSSEISNPVSKLDIKPTLSYLSGLDDYFSLGMNMFSSKNFACVNNGRIITDKYYYNGSWYRIDNAEELKMNDLEIEDKDLYNELKDYERYMNTELDISNSVLLQNLLKDKFKKDQNENNINRNNEEIKYDDEQI